MLSNGIPMFAAGDEFLHTQGGNNNPYNQTQRNHLAELGTPKKNSDIFRFVKLMISFRKAHPTISSQHILAGRHPLAGGGVVRLTCPITLRAWPTISAASHSKTTTST